MIIFSKCQSRVRIGNRLFSPLPSKITIIVELANTWTYMRSRAYYQALCWLNSLVRSELSPVFRLLDSATIPFRRVISR